MIALKLTRIGDAVGVASPTETLAKPGVEKGDTLYLNDVATGAMPIGQLELTDWLRTRVV